MRRSGCGHDDSERVHYGNKQSYCRSCAREHWYTLKAAREARQALAELREWMQSEEAKQILGRAA